MLHVPVISIAKVLGDFFHGPFIAVSFDRGGSRRHPHEYETKTHDQSTHFHNDWTPSRISLTTRCSHHVGLGQTSHTLSTTTTNAKQGCGEAVSCSFGKKKRIDSFRVLESRKILSDVRCVPPTSVHCTSFRRPIRVAAGIIAIIS